LKKLYLLSTIIIALVLINSGLSFSQPTWQIVNLGTYENLNSVSFPDIYNGYIAGNNSKLFRTANGGLNWTPIPSPANGNNLFVYFMNVSTGFVSNQGGFFKTTNSGDNWMQITMPSAYVITSVNFSSASTGWLGNTYGQVLKTTNGGDDWTILHTLPGYNSIVYFVNDFTGWAVDTYGYVRRTTNGGTNFTSIRISTDTLSGIHFISSTVGMIAADSGRVFKTTNGGSDWTLLNTGVINKLTSIYMESPSKSYATGHYGLVLYGYSGGYSWNYENISVNNLFKITFPLNVSAGWIVGEAGSVYKRVNPENLACMGTGTTSIGYPFFSYYMDSRTDMLYLSSEITANGGGPGTVTSIGFYFDSVSTQTLNGFKIKMKNTTMTTLTGFDSTGWTTVYSGFYLPSQGTGLQLIPLNSPFMYESGKNLLVEICFNNSSYTVNSYVKGTTMPGMTFHGHADLTTGDGCVAITTGAVQNVRPNMCIVSNFITNEGGLLTGIPKEYKLHQNYPNPFNPVTKIQYDIPKATFVSLKIYDILGREAAALVNENKAAGSFTVEFNASGLTSGVYFYRLKTSAYSEIKKMILLK
jgi:photosystem II stability/assembly factor-like uncharacterized protein